MTEFGEKPWGANQTQQSYPVFELNCADMTEYPNGDRLPSVTVTEPIVDEKGACVGRAFVVVYPFTARSFVMNPYQDDGFSSAGCYDEHGRDALYWGGRYYEEGMGYTSPEDRDKRVDCFRAAEILYRHSAARGNAVASMCLGYVYSYDRCEGRYWRGAAACGVEEDCGRPYPREERAFECLSVAAGAGLPEACYKLGDLYKHGTGCSPNAAEAFRWYERALDLAAHESPVILGSIALRLAGCYEEGFGCKRNVQRALLEYQAAETALEIAVDNGEAWYEKALAGARAGGKRCLQEILFQTSEGLMS